MENIPQLQCQNSLLIGLPLVTHEGIVAFAPWTFTLVSHLF
jgi:hypothetical protein